MTPVYQRLVDPVRGDCQRCCIATVTGIPYEQVPDFTDPELPLQDQQRFWLHRHGYGAIESRGWRLLDQVVWTGLWRLVAVASVPSQKYEGCLHAIVVGWRPAPDFPDLTPMEGGPLEMYVIHDPNPTNAPYTRLNDIVQGLTWLVPHFNLE